MKNIDINENLLKMESILNKLGWEKRSCDWIENTIGMPLAGVLDENFEAFYKELEKFVTEPEKAEKARKIRLAELEAKYKYRKKYKKALIQKYCRKENKNKTI